MSPGTYNVAINGNNKSIEFLQSIVVNKPMKYISKSEKDTARLAARLAPLLRSGDVVCLQGDLGAGKSVLARALIRHLCDDQTMDVPSPTFTLVQSYEGLRAPIAHFDLYRIAQPDDIYELGWDDAISDSITIIEWPERLESLAPVNRLTLGFAIEDDQSKIRAITIRPEGTWAERDIKELVT